MLDYNGQTPLHVAANEGQEETVRFLLEHGALVHVTDRFGNSPLDCAVFHAHMGCIEQLRAAGAHLKLACFRQGMILGDLAARGDIHHLKVCNLYSPMGCAIVNRS